MFASASKYIENKGKLYKCRVCPGQRWKNRISMAQHQRMGVTHNRLVEAVRQKQIYAEEASEDDDEDEEASVYHLDELPDELAKESTPPALDMRDQAVEMNEEWTYDSTSSMLDDAHMTSSEEPESSEPIEQHSPRIQIDSKSHTLAGKHFVDSSRVLRHRMRIFCGKN
ncbi:hypothetical protein FRC07_012078 [Ceratobasidium sp. 392]|nr:hypothetical protein FRC07_012078 [Ceratobasidium sp. 392]